MTTTTTPDTAARTLVTRIIQLVKPDDLTALAGPGEAPPSRADLRAHIVPLVKSGGGDARKTLDHIESLGQANNAGIELYGHEYGALDNTGVEVARAAFEDSQKKRVAAFEAKRGELVAMSQRMQASIDGHAQALGELAAADATVKSLDKQIEALKALRDEAARVAGALREKLAKVSEARTTIVEIGKSVEQLDIAMAAVKDEPNPFSGTPPTGETPGDVLTLVARLLLSIIQEDAPAAT